jgi:hypothetical protein
VYARVERPVPSPALRLAVSEAWNGGSRLVLVDERGDRWAVLSAGRAAAPSRDEQAVFSPDGRWVAFVSSRGRDLARTSLWVMPAAVGATAVRVTDGTGDDVDPVWTPAGDAVVFARRVDATFALARVTIAGRGDAVAIGPVERLTTGGGHHVAPSVGDRRRHRVPGDRSRRRAQPDRAARRRRQRHVPDRRPARRDAGVAAGHPGRAGVRARGRSRRRRPRLSICSCSPLDAGAPRPLLELAGHRRERPALVGATAAGCSRPRWRTTRTARCRRSCTSTPPSRGRPPRMLRDAVGAIARQGPAPMPVALDAAALAGGPAFAAALSAALDERAIARAAVDAGVGDASAADAGL